MNLNQIIILVDRQRHFGLDPQLNSKIPLISPPKRKLLERNENSS